MNQALAGGGGGSGYSDELFEAITDEIEALLADLLGIETAAQWFIDRRRRISREEEEIPGGSTYVPLTLPARSPFTVLPVIGGSDDFQAIIDGAYAAGAATAGGIGAWLRSLMDGFYLVDTVAIVDGAAEQARLVETQGIRTVDDLDEVSRNLWAHWDGDARGAFGEWVAGALNAVTTLMIYANGAQVAAATCGVAIKQVQRTMLAQVESTRDLLRSTIRAWHDDAHIFPDPPGTGFKFSAIGAAIQGPIDELVARIPGPDPLKDVIADAAEGALTGAVAKKVPGVGAVLTIYDLAVTSETYQVDVPRQQQGRAILAHLEDALRDLAQEGRAAIDSVAARITVLADHLAGDADLVLPRLDRHPRGRYDPD